MKRTNWVWTVLACGIVSDFGIAASLEEVYPGVKFAGGRQSGDVNELMQQRLLEDIEIRQEYERQNTLAAKAESLLSKRSNMTSNDWEWVRCHKDEPCLQRILPLVIDASFKDLSCSFFIKWLERFGAFILEKKERNIAIFLNNNYLSDNDLEYFKNFIISDDQLKCRLVYLNIRANRFTKGSKSTVETILGECSQEAVCFM